MRLRTKHMPTDPPLAGHAAARVAFSQDAKELSEFAAALVATVGDHDDLPGEHITQARRARILAQELVKRAVILERVKGRSWAQIAAEAGQDEDWTRDTYGPAVAEFEAQVRAARRGEPQTERDLTLDQALLLPASDAPVGADAVRKAAEGLDEWCVAHQRAHSLPGVQPPQRPVTDGILGV